MIIYSVTISIARDSEREWLKYMKEKHIQDVLNTGCFSKYTFLKSLDVTDGPRAVYNIRYHCNDMDNYRHYADEFAPALKAEVLEKFGNKFSASRELLEAI